MNDEPDVLDRFVAFFDDAAEVDVTPEERAALRRRIEELCDE